MRSLGGLLAIVVMLVALPARAAPPAIAIIIDDLGDRHAESSAAVALPGAVACAFLPGSPHTPALAMAAHRAGKEVLVHLPLQPVNGRAHPQVLATAADATNRDAALAQMLGAVPHAIGVNNHQGSLATADRTAMRWLMRQLAQHRVGYFIDSMTSAQSVAYPLARAYGLPTARRHVFLDNVQTPEAINASFDELLRQARRRGAAVAIGHPYPATLQVLRERLGQLDKEGVVLLAPSQLIARYEPQPPPLLPVQLKLTPRLSTPAPSPN